MRLRLLVVLIVASALPARTLAQAPEEAPLSRVQTRALARLERALASGDVDVSHAQFSRLSAPGRRQAELGVSRLLPLARAALALAPERRASATGVELLRAMRAMLCDEPAAIALGTCLRLALDTGATPRSQLEVARTRMQLQDRDLAVALRAIAAHAIRAGELELGREALGLAAQVRPQDSAIERERALVDLALGRASAATARLRALRARTLRDPDARADVGDLAGAYAAAGEHEAADAFLQPTPGETRDEAVVRLLRRGALALEAGRDAPARRDARAVLERTSADAPRDREVRATAHRLLTLAALRQGDDVTARETLRRALRAAPTDPGLRVLAGALGMSPDEDGAENEPAPSTPRAP